MPTITMNDSPIITIEQIKSFLQLDNGFQFAIATKREKYRWIEDALRKFRYHRLKRRKEKSIMRRYIEKVTRISAAQLTVLVRRHKKRGRLVPDYTHLGKHKFKVKFGPKDIALLIETDYAHGHISGKATKAILVREYTVFGRKEYAVIATISCSHIYNIRRHNRQYTSSKAKWVAQTKAVDRDIGIRTKPRPNGIPGFLRVDTVHSGDENGEKGAYYINIVDEVTQWEMVACVPDICEHTLAPVVETLITLYPFVIHEFHSDNGSEYINHTVAKLIAKLYARFTKSRARHSNDNALVESKNGSIIRKLYGHWHIPKAWAPFVDEFNRTHVNVYLNFHRPCAYAEDEVLPDGKVRKKYTTWMTPYEKLKSLKDAEKYLKPGITFGILDKIALEKSDNQFAETMRNAKAAVFEKLRKNF